MCGIFGYIGPKNVVKTVLSGLKKLEYRGYDSAGIAGMQHGKIAFAKEVGKIAELEREVVKSNIQLDIGVGHTRWATHGVPSLANAHPHFDSKHTLAIVHNGIIENYQPIKDSLKEKGVKFVSDTDTEVVAQLIASLYQGDIVKAVLEAVSVLEGAFAIALIHKDYPDQIIAFAHEAPLIVGIGKGEVFLASDTHSFASHTREVIYLVDREVAVLKREQLEFFDQGNCPIDKEIEKLAETAQEHSKGEYDHYTLKEIFDQPQAIRNALSGRFLEEYGTAIFEGIEFDVHELKSVQRILILACGTSWHAGFLGAYMLEDKARIPVSIEISSEFRYKNPVISEGTLVIAISQSGETADTVAAVKELKAKGARILSICNVENSTLVREAHSTIYLHAGLEVGVCSTKAFTSQVVVLSLFTLMMARMRHMGLEEGILFSHAIKKLPDQISKVLEKLGEIEKIAKKYAHFENFFFLGRNYMFPTSLEGALKLKEISYINANGYPAGEMKHGPIALINENCPTVAMCANKATYDKLVSNLMEIKARSGKIIAIAEEGCKGLEKIADDIIYIPQNIDELLAIPSVVVAQILAYHIAKIRGTDIDQPRNLAKSVTVE
jgi:glucosamine--fructose-6-phosphate aminotransferase (isomerizing)